MNFENSLKRLEEIINDLENGNLSLEESISLYEEGTELYSLCKNQLETAKIKISEKDTDGGNYEIRK